MKKLIKKNPVKAQKISLVIFVVLMVLNGVVTYIFNSLLCAILIPLVAIIQLVKIITCSKHCIKEIASEQSDSFDDFLKKYGYLFDKYGEVSADVEYEDKTE